MPETNTLRALTAAALADGSWSSRDLGEHGAQHLGELADLVRLAQVRLFADVAFAETIGGTVDAKQVARELRAIKELVLDLGHDIYPLVIDAREARQAERPRRMPGGDPYRATGPVPAPEIPKDYPG